MWRGLHRGDQDFASQIALRRRNASAVMTTIRHVVHSHALRPLTTDAPHYSLKRALASCNSQWQVADHAPDGEASSAWSS